ncbi:MAG: ComF family protein [Bacteroidota bacterium]
MKNFNQFFDFFIPRLCTSCQTKLSPEQKFICPDCLRSIQIAGDQRIGHEYERKFESEKIISDLASAFIFEKDKALQHLIHSLKYNENFKVGIFLGKLVAEKLQSKLTGWEAEYIIPVPLHRLKKAERGYNQSFYLAKGIAAKHKITIKQNILKRNRFTKTQTELDLHERKVNVKGAFALTKQKLIIDKKIILLDDVITTGATISECGRLLLENGAKKVFALSVALAD